MIPLAQFRPDFRDWILAQSDDARLALSNEWQRLQTDPRVKQGHRNADHARRLFLMQYAALILGWKG